MPEFSREHFRQFLHHLRTLQRPLVQDADLAACFLLALADTDTHVSQFGARELRVMFTDLRRELIELGAAEDFMEGGHHRGYLVGTSRVPEAEEAFCSIDPFSYISHLSAMGWHGLTDRIPKTLFVTRPSVQLWKELSQQRLQRILGGLYPVYKVAEFPNFHRVALHKLNKRPVSIWTSSRLNDAYQAAYKKVADGRVRIATVGRCFLDMVREPDLCGGIYHVIEVFKEHGPSYTEHILVEIDRHGNKIERARCGYLLETANPDIAGNPILDRWASNVIRGGSRKLDPTSEYSDHYSERWALSLNV